MPKDYTPFANRLRKMARHYDKWARRQELEAYRIYDADLDEFPITVDRYGDQLYVAVYHRRGENWDEAEWQDRKLAYRDILMEVLEMGRDQIFFKLRKRQSGTSQYEKLSIVQREFTVVENDLGFIVNLTDYLDTGLFLDHRQTRMMVSQEAKGKMVCNLFAYTCSFSVYAAAGGATRVDSVDLSNTYLQWGKRNFELNEIDPTEHRFIKADVLQWAAQAPAASYDLIILDPPTFSNSKMMREVLDTQQDHIPLIQQTMRMLRPGGTLYFSTNYRKFKLDESALEEFSIKDITKQTLPPDFRKRNLHQSYRIKHQ
jgi:23S rRNA (cytosine1962-C5)-methyltransferase